MLSRTLPTVPCILAWLSAKRFSRLSTENSTPRAITWVAQPADARASKRLKFPSGLRWDCRRSSSNLFQQPHILGALDSYPLTGPPNAETFVPFSVWPLISQDILRQCDHLDGAVDGILESPDLCDYDPSGLICSDGQDSSTCLTEHRPRQSAVYTRRS